MKENLVIGCGESFFCFVLEYYRERRSCETSSLVNLHSWLLEYGPKDCADSLKGPLHPIYTSAFLPNKLLLHDG